jgi:penicillin-binding protein 2
MIALVGILVQRIFTLQVVRGEQYQENYDLKIQKTRSLNSTRGNIYDRDGNLLAYNELAYSVTIEDNGSYDTAKEKNKTINGSILNILHVMDKNKDSVDNSFDVALGADGKYFFTVKDNALLRFLGDVYGRSKLDDDKFVNENKKLGYTESKATPDQVVEFLCTKKDGTGYGLTTKDYSPQDLYRILAIRFAMSENGYQKYIATTIASNVSSQTVAYVNENASDLQGVSVAEDTVRKYNDSKYFAHLIGYTGKISQPEYDTLSKANKNYTLTDVIGKAGIEQVMDSQLQGTKGNETVYVDSVGHVIETTNKVAPSSGDNVYLSVKKDLQESVYNLLEQEIAGIVYTKIENIKEYNAGTESSASDIKIPIYDVYYALINNNVIDMRHFSAADASQTEQAVLAAFTNKQNEVIDGVNTQLTSPSPTAFSGLSEEQQVYMTYIVSMLSDKNILLKDKIQTTDPIYQNWKNKKISLEEFLNHAIGQKWIDITQFAVGEKYSDSTEIYGALVNYILTELKDDRGFSKKIYKYLIQENGITGTQLCLILYDQKVLNNDPAAITALSNGSMSSFNFLKEKIRTLEITPAQLALDPCSGSCVITDVKTGEILACVSYPGYDNNRLANTVDSNYYASLNEDLSLPLYDYATQQKTAPGSTFKMVTASAGLTDHYLSGPNDMITDLGVFDKVANGPKCWIYPNTHGTINVSQAIRDSCNYFFYEVGYRMSMQNGVYNEAQGISEIQKFASLYGLNETTGVEIPESKPKIADEYPITAAIGQSDNSYTTIQLSRYVTAVASSGNVFKYTLLNKVDDSNGKTIQTFAPSVRNQIDVISNSTWNAIHSGMRMVVETHKQFDGFGVNVAGKTGTAQQIKTRPNHALFVGYAPYEDPQIAIATRIAYGYDSANATSFAANVLKYYFNLQDPATLLNHQATDVGNTRNSFND